MRAGYAAQLLTGPKGEERSFEELRATAARDASKKSTMRAAEQQQSMASAAGKPQAAPLTPRPTAASVLHHPISPSLLPSPTSTSASGLRLSLAPSGASPTVCTRSALHDIDAMFKDSPITPHAHGRNSLHHLSFASTTGAPAAVRHSSRRCSTTDRMSSSARRL